jgi:hypothetical protein
MTGSNNNMILTANANQPGVLGNNISLEIVGGSGAHTLSVTIDKSTSPYVAIVVQAATTSGTITSTCNDVRALLYANQGIVGKDGVLDSVLNSGGDGTGLVTVFSHTHLSGGVDSDWLTRLATGTKLAVVAYVDSTSSPPKRFEGIGTITKLTDSVKFGKITNGPLEITGWDRCAYHSG